MRTRPILLIFSLLNLFSLAIFAQRQPQVPFSNEQSDKPLTDLEVFQDSYGAALLKGFTELPRIRGTNGTVQVTIVEFRNAANNTRVKGVAIDVATVERQSEKARSFIEYAELESLIRGITLISKIDKSATSLQNLEAVFTTKGEFSISNFFNWQGEPRIAVTAGRFDPRTTFIDTAGQNNLLAQLQQAKATLDE
jgi:hypothetical protein